MSKKQQAARKAKPSPRSRRDGGGDGRDRTKQRVAAMVEAPLAVAESDSLRRARRPARHG